jgi:hypothetical protein
MMKKRTIFSELSFVVLLAFSCSTTRTELSNAPLNIDKNPNAGIPRSSIIEIDSFDLDIVPPSSGVQFYRDGIMFLSVSKYDDNMLSNHLSFGKPKAYFSNIYEGTLFKYADFSPTMPFPYPCDAVTFSSDFKTMYFTKISNLDGKEKIFKATFTTSDNFQTGWSADGFPLSFCQGDFIYSHPALSTDGKFMIVSSNRKDSYGGMDLYISTKDCNNWSELRNLGENVNSVANDFYPFLDNENNLFFSSDKKGGCGGYDIYICKYNGTGWYKPVALTNRINTQGDDIAFTLNRKDGKSAFYTTTTVPGKSKPQLFRITINPDATKNSTKTLTSILYDMTGAHVEPATVPAYKVESGLAASGQRKTGEKSGTVKSTGTGKKQSQTATTQTKSTATAATSELLYRVQILTSTQSKGSYNLTINNKIYKTYEYLYKGAYRITIGEFNTYSQALKLLNECHQAYPNAFVVVFKNNIRINDPSLLK